MLSLRRPASVPVGLGAAVLALAAVASPALAADATEVVDKSVKFLISKQAEDGSWSVAPGKPEMGITGLIAKGLHESGRKDAAPAVEKAVGYLLKQQKEDGSFNDDTKGLATYRTAIAVLALCSID